MVKRLAEDLPPVTGYLHWPKGFHPGLSCSPGPSLGPPVMAVFQEGKCGFWSGCCRPVFGRQGPRGPLRDPGVVFVVLFFIAMAVKISTQKTSCINFIRRLEG